MICYERCFSDGVIMRSLVITLSLLTIGSNQAIAGKRPFILKKMKTPHSSVYLPPVSRCLVLAGVGCMAFSFALLPVGSMFPELSMGGVGSIANVTGFASFVGGLAYGYARRNRVTEGEEIGAQVIYLDDYGDIRRGEVVASNSYGSKLLVEGRGDSPIDFKMRRGFLGKHHIYRPVEVLSQVGKTESLRRVGYVVSVLDGGFYELELIAEVDFYDLENPHLYSERAIEPYRVFIDENVAFEDGGFRFDRRVAGVVYENLFKTL